MVFRLANEDKFLKIKNFYLNLIDAMHDQKDKMGYEKWVYPSDRYIMDSIEKRELYVMEHNTDLAACVILNSSSNDGYKKVRWKTNFPSEDILVPHALAVNHTYKNRDIGRKVVENIIKNAKENNKKEIRLDIFLKNDITEIN